MYRVARVICASAFAALAVAAGATSAEAAPAVGGCPEHFQLISLEDLAPLLHLTVEQVAAIPSLDINGDSRTCYTQLPNGRFAGLDNVVPTP